MSTGKPVWSTAEQARLEAALVEVRACLAWKNLLLTYWPSVLLLAAIWAGMIAESFRLDMYNGEDFDLSLVIAQMFPAIALTVFAVLIVISRRKGRDELKEQAWPVLKRMMAETGLVLALARNTGQLDELYQILPRGWRLVLGRKPSTPQGWARFMVANLIRYLAPEEYLIPHGWIYYVLSFLILIVLSLRLFAVLFGPTLVGAWHGMAGWLAEALSTQYYFSGLTGVASFLAILNGPVLSLRDYNSRMLSDELEQALAADHNAL